MEKNVKIIGKFFNCQRYFKNKLDSNFKIFHSFIPLPLPINFNTNLLSQAEESLQRITDFYYQILLAKNKNSKSVNSQEKIHLAKIRFLKKIS